MLKFKRKKQPSQAHAQQHPQYLAGAQSSRTWVDDERDKNGHRVRRKFATIIGFAVVILVVLVFAATTAYVSTTQTSTNSITASDTYAISSEEQSSMESTAKAFATAVLVSAYVDDQSLALDAKDVALSCMAEGTDSYQNVSDMVIGNGTIASDNLQIYVSEPEMTNGSRSYAGKYTYTLHAQAIDKSLGTDTTTDENGNTESVGMYVDPGYDLTVVFIKAYNANDVNDSAWVISSAKISQSS